MAVYEEILYEADRVNVDGTTEVAKGRAKLGTTTATIDGSVNSSSGEDATVNWSVILTRSRRRFGVHARYITISRVVGSGASSFRVHDRLPIFEVATFAAVTKNSVVVYNTFTWEVVDIIEEKAT